MNSFTVRCIFRLNSIANQKLSNLYEERITIWQAENLDHAIHLAELEAADYADGSCEFLGFSQAYAMFEEAQVHGIEIFSLIRESNLDAEEYIDAFFDNGTEHQSVNN